MAEPRPNPFAVGASHLAGGGGGLPLGDQPDALVSVSCRSQLLARLSPSMALPGHPATEEDRCLPATPAGEPVLRVGWRRTAPEPRGASGRFPQERGGTGTPSLQPHPQTDRQADRELPLPPPPASFSPEDTPRAAACRGRLGPGREELGRCDPREGTGRRSQVLGGHRARRTRGGPGGLLSVLFLIKTLGDQLPWPGGVFGGRLPAEPGDGAAGEVGGGFWVVERRGSPGQHSPGGRGALILSVSPVGQCLRGTGAVLGWGPPTCM